MTQKNLIAGEWLDGDNAIENRNPSDVSDLIGMFAQATSDQLEATLDQARVAQAEWAAYGLERKQAVLNAIGNEMMEVPEFAADLLQPFKSQGVFDFDDVGMIIRGKFMAKPGRQFVLRKEIYNRVKKTFEENGIAFARREVRVAIPGLESASELTEDDKAAISAAAGEAANQAADGGAPNKA